MSLRRSSPLRSAKGSASRAKGNVKMNKMVMMAAAVAVGLVAGCGNAESQYESVVREGNALISGGTASESDVAQAMKEFRAMTPEQQKKELEKAKKELSEIKKMAKEMGE